MIDDGFSPSTKGLTPSDKTISMSGQELLVAYAVSLTLCAAFDLTGSAANVGWAIALLMLTSTVVARPLVAVVILLLLLCGQDITESATEVFSGRMQMGSPWKLAIGPVSPGVLIFGFALALGIRLGSIQLPRCVRMYAVYAGLVGVGGLIIGMATGTSVPFGMVTGDISMVAGFVVFFHIFYTFLRKHPQFTVILWQWLVIILAARTTVYFAHWILGIGAVGSGFVRVSVDSTKSIVVLITLWGIYHALQAKNWQFAFPAIVVGTTLSMVFLTRLIIIDTIIGIVILLALMRGLKAAFLLLPIVLASSYAVALLIEVVVPESGWIMLKRVQMLGGISTLDLKQIDPFRYLELVNCFSQLAADGTIVTGRGFGGWYSDDTIPFRGDLAAAFSRWNILNGKFHRVHNAVGHMILKCGIVGTALWLRMYYAAFRSLIGRISANARFHEIRLCLAAFLPTVALSNYWSTKGMLLTGFCLAVAFLPLKNRNTSRTRSLLNHTESPRPSYSHSNSG